ncbi:MAG: pirin family protein [Frankia sp.]|nr:pirin family protein [Frankia sp.]
MSGPVSGRDIPPDVPGPAAAGGPAEIEVSEASLATVGAIPVRRALPRRARRTVGAWCFVDLMGPVAVSGVAAGAGAGPAGLDIGPHPHTGLHTVTWLLAGEVRHVDSTGADQPVRPGQLNLMTAGHGVAHAEEATDHRGTLQGVQLWVAQPEATRHGPAAFEHHPALPSAELDRAVATVLVGELAGAVSPARRDTELVGADVAHLGGRAVLPLRRDFEHAVVVLEGVVLLPDGRAAGAGGPVVARPGQLAYLGTGRDEVALDAAEPARLLLLGGVPFPEAILMWWNFVARDRAEVATAARQWASPDGGGRFGPVASRLDPVPAPPLPWRLAAGGAG